MRMPEMIDIYDAHRNRTGRICERGTPMREGEYRLVVYAWLLNPKNEVLLTRRHPSKVWGGYWECTAGHVQAGENSLEGALRELREEVGVEADGQDGMLLRQETDGSVFVDAWLFHSETPAESLVLQASEVTDAKWAGRTEYEEMCRKGLLVPACTEFSSWRKEERKNG
jgi:8-oxo-dGTP diphosphatase